LDKGTDGKQEEIIQKQNSNNKHLLPFTLRVEKDKVNEMNQLLEKMDIVNEYLIELAKAPISPENLELIIGSLRVVIFTIITRTAIPSIYAAQFMNKRVAELENAIREIAQKVSVELPELLKSENYVEVRKFVDKLNRQIEAYNKQKEENDLAT